MKLAAFLLLMGFCTSQAHLLLNLNGQQWQLTNSNESISVRGQVPGGVYSDLRQGGILKEDLFYRFNDEEYRWVSRDNWTYSTEFIFDDAEKSEEEDLHLVFDGVDTIAEIFLNNIRIGKCNNMFIKYRFPIKRNIIKSGLNALEVRLESAVGWAKKQASVLPHEVPSECWPVSYHGECHVNLIRKMQASFAWDWGPAFPSMGIWKAVYLEKCWSPVLNSVGNNVKDKGNHFLVRVTAWFDQCGEDTMYSGILTARLHLGSKTIDSRSSVTLSENTHFLEGSTDLVVNKSEVELWWPNGYGKQVLYDLEVSFSSQSDLQVEFTHLAFRTVKVIQEPIPDNATRKGLGFHFQINGVDIYAKGSNWIPSDILPERSANASRIRHLLQSAASAHFNMLRVWGGGFYESTLFYRMCDRLGIMLWHDLMFACNMYPATPDFLSSVSVEVAQQVARLQHHPSIVIWAGNNENEAALAQNWYDTKSKFSLFKKEYIDLYVTTIKPIVNSLDESRTYLESSPSNGIESVKEGYIASNPQSSLYGDVHYYNYMSNMWDPAVFPKTRFTSEFGVQSLPSMETLEEVATKSDLELNSKWINWRQHQEGGFIYLLTQIPYNLPMPKNLQQFVYYSQINQAMSIQVESETYRRMRSVVYSTGEGKNMGALYWQLNDVWQAPSWSSIDYSGRWKMLHYYSMKFFAPVMLTAWVTPYDWVSVYVVSDKLEMIPAAKLTISLMSTKFFVPLQSTSSRFNVLPNEAAEVLSEELSILRSVCERKNECFLHFALKDELANDIAPDAYLFPEKVKNMDLIQANIRVTNCVQVSMRKIRMHLETDAVALFVWLEVPGMIGTFSDNGFHMIRPSIILNFKSIDHINIDANAFCKLVTVKHLKSE